MRRRIARIWLISKARGVAARERGSVTLEAAMLMPLCLLLVFFLIFMVRTAVLSMALNGALSQTVRQAASAWYPISAAIGEAKGTRLGQQADAWSAKLEKAGDALSRFGSLLPSPIREWADQAARGELLDRQAAKLAFEPILARFADDAVLDAARLKLTDVELPSAEDPSHAYLTLRAEYALPMRVPFIGKRLVISQSARERVWIGGSVSNARIAEDGETESLQVTFVSLEPNPARPGRKATLTVRTTPGASVDLSVLYKSGLSQAKHLGTAIADAEGYVSWTWLVSGRTTPGEWTFKITSGERSGVWEHSFEVRSAASGGG